MRRLVGDFFTGRNDELARVHAHLDGVDPSILFIAGTGGAGKSALLAKALLQRTEQTRNSTSWVRVDIADSNVNLTNPITLLTQAAQQLARRDSLLERVVANFVSEAGSRRLSE